MTVHSHPMDIESLSLEDIEGVDEIFTGKCVFITGVTGFLGKVLLEKLLRSCQGIEEICVLLRPKKGINPENRLSSLLEHKVFDRVKTACPHVLQKIHLLSGDVTLEKFGMVEKDYKKVEKDVQIVFHCAANVRFDDEPINTLKINLLGVQHTLEVCKEMSKLEALVHVSTAFSFCNHKHIDETVYPEQEQPRQILQALQCMTNEELKKFCKSLTRNRPSLYQYSKAMAEILIENNAKDLPVVIVRPSIVTPAAAEPYPGWIDNYNGPSGFILLCGKGIIKTLLVKPKVNADLMPVDTACNVIIVAAYHLVLMRTKITAPLERIKGTPPIVNCVCPNSNLITWTTLTDVCLPLLIKYPSITVYGLPGGTVTSCPVRYFLCRMFSHYLPALLIDAVTFLRKGQSMMYNYKRIHRVMDHMEHYTTHPYIFSHRNLDLLHRQLKPKDREVFPIYLNNLDWPQYFENYVLGVRRYYLKENDETLPEARKKMMQIYRLWLILKVMSAIGVGYICLRHSHFKLPSISLKRSSFSVLSAVEYIHYKIAKLF